MSIESHDNSQFEIIAESMFSDLGALSTTPELIDKVTQTLEANPDWAKKNAAAIFDLVCQQEAQDLIHELEAQGKTKPEIRSQNAQRVNQAQKIKYKVLHLLKSFVYSANIKTYNSEEQKERDAVFEKAFAKLEANPEKRDLVLYFRSKRGDIEGSSQVDPVEFGMAFWILNYYIQNGYSKIFNGLKIVSRTGNAYPQWIQDQYPETQYSDAQGNQFLVESAVGANCIHFSEGLPEQAFYGSMPILGVSARRRKKKMKNLGPNDYVRLFLDYNKDLASIRDIYLEDPIPPQNGSFANVMTEILRAIQELEEKMIDETNTPPLVIGLKALTKAAVQASHE